MEKVALSTLSQVFFALHSILNNKASASVYLPNRRRRVHNEWKTLEDICMPQYWRGDDKRVANKAGGDELRLWRWKILRRACSLLPTDQKPSWSSNCLRSNRDNDGGKVIQGRRCPRRRLLSIATIWSYLLSDGLRPLPRGRTKSYV